MRAVPSLLAVLLMLSSTSLAQTAEPTTQEPVATAPTASSEAAVTPFAPGAKVFLEPMNGFEELLAEDIVKKKVPVVVVKERENADFVLSGEVHLKQYGWLAGNLLWPHGGVRVSIKDAHTGGEVFAFSSKRVDSNTAAGWVYQIWADNCTKHLKKALEKK